MPPTPSHVEFISRGLIVHCGHVLVCWNPKGEYGYLPGGHVETGESAATALVREMAEETGLACRVGPLLLTHENQFGTKKRVHHEVNFVFAAEIVDPEFLAASDEMCHVAQSDKPSIPGSRDRSARSKHPLTLPPVVSQEDHLAFRWLTSAALRKADIRPNPMAKWASRLLAEGLDSTVGMLPSGAPTSEWLSTMRVESAPK